jgi:hypothetical protein
MMCGVAMPWLHFLAPALSLIAGVALLTYASRAHQLTRGVANHPGRYALEWVAMFVVISLGLFWAVHQYSSESGLARAKAYEARLGSTPNAVLFSDRSLNLSVPGVSETRCETADAAYRYRYDGLKLVLQSGDVLLLLPADWSRAAGPALVIPRTDALRLEFTAAPTAPGAAC